MQTGQGFLASLGAFRSHEAEQQILEGPHIYVIVFHVSSSPRPLHTFNFRSEIPLHSWALCAGAATAELPGYACNWAPPRGRFGHGGRVCIFFQGRLPTLSHRVGNGHFGLSTPVALVLCEPVHISFPVPIPQL